MANVYIVYHSGFGHTKLQAEAVHRGAASVPGTRAEIRTTEEASANLDELDEADAIIFGCPTYMGNLSAEMKKFIEVAARKWFSLAWKDKIAGAFTNSSSFSGDKLNTLIGLVINAMQHGMIYVEQGCSLPRIVQKTSSRSQDPVRKLRIESGLLRGRCPPVFKCRLQGPPDPGTSRPLNYTGNESPKSREDGSQGKRSKRGKENSGVRSYGPGKRRTQESGVRSYRSCRMTTG